MTFKLPPLPYPTDALASRGMSQETLELHHGKHHQAYVTALNGLVSENPALAGKSLEELLALSVNNPAMTPVLNNAGQHWNHSFFWENLSPQGGKIPAALEKKIIEDFGSVENFKKEFQKAALSQFGSGWAWLVETPSGRLVIVKTANGSNPLAEKTGTPLLGLDVWEHSYYLDFRNRRADYATNFLDHLANYEFAQKRRKKH